VTDLFTKACHGNEWPVLQHVHRHDPDLCPRPVALEADPPAVTMTTIPGSPLSGPLTADQIDALLHSIHRLWAIPFDGPWRDDLHFARRLVRLPRPSGALTAQAYDAALAWWDGPDPLLLKQKPSVTVLGHRDPYLANYLWDGSRVRIVDFEDSCLSDPATEVAILLEHLSTRDSGLHSGLFDVDPLRLLAARRLWAMFWLWRLLPGGPSEHRNPPGTADRQAQRLLDLLVRAAG
jgi:aminoglycoside phosphotransferase (APT) family kinase protein